MIAYILGWIMKLEGLFMLIPVLVALIYREHNGVWFAIVAVCALVFGRIHFMCAHLNVFQCTVILCVVVMSALLNSTFDTLIAAFHKNPSSNLVQT